MSYNIYYWCDSGANCESCREDTISTDELGITEKEWDDMSEDEQTNMMREVALDRLDWGFRKQ
jgi:hypothetical protein